MKILYILPVLSMLSVNAFTGIGSETKNTTNNDIKAYIGFDLNYVDAQLSDKFSDEFDSVTGYSTNTDEFINPKHYGFTLTAGAQLNKYFGLEGFLQYISSSTAEIDFYYAGTKILDYKSKTSGLAFGFDAMGYAPITNTKFSFIGSLGLGYYNFDGKFDLTDCVHNISDSDSGDENNIGFRVGIGGQYDFSENFAMRGIVRYIMLNYDENEDVIEGLINVSLGLRYTF